MPFIEVLPKPDSVYFRAKLLEPVRFPSWATTCGRLVAAIAAGPGLVVLVGSEGSGKTYTLLAVATGGGRRSTAIRRPHEAIEPGVSVDMVDGVEPGMLDELVNPPPGMVRVLAVRPDQLPAIDDRRPDRRVVGVQPMTKRDVRAFLEVRRALLPQSVDAFVLRAFAKLALFTVDRPAVLDQLIERICHEAARERPHRAAATREPGQDIGDPIGRTGFERHRPTFASTSWDMLQTVPVEIKQAGQITFGRRRRQGAGGGAMIAAGVLAVSLVVNPQFRATVFGIPDTTVAVAAPPDPAPVPDTGANVPAPAAEGRAVVEVELSPSEPAPPRAALVGLALAEMPVTHVERFVPRPVAPVAPVVASAAPMVVSAVPAGAAVLTELHSTSGRLRPPARPGPKRSSRTLRCR